MVRSPRDFRPRLVPPQREFIGEENHRCFFFIKIMLLSTTTTATMGRMPLSWCVHVLWTHASKAYKHACHACRNHHLWQTHFNFPKHPRHADRRSPSCSHSPLGQVPPMYVITVIITSTCMHAYAAPSNNNNHHLHFYILANHPRLFLRTPSAKSFS